VSQSANRPQLALGLYRDGQTQPSAPPPTRGDCGQIARPCTRTSCPHNKHRDDEPAGRPHENGGRRVLQVRAVGESCALDVADRGGHSYRQVAGELGVTEERVRQLEKRGLVKQRLAHDLLEHLESYRSKLPEGAEMTVETPRHGATHSVLIVVTVEETAIHDVAKRLGVSVRRPKLGKLSPGKPRADGL